MSAVACRRCECELESTDLRCPVCGRSTPALEQPTEQVRTRVLRCTNCAACIAYDVEHSAPACVYCGAVYELEEHEDPLERVDAWLPFSVTPDQARRALQDWWSTLGWFRPSDLRTASRLEELRPVWWVGWCFSARAQVSWSADSNDGAKRADWAPHAGQADLEFRNLVVSASQGLTWSEAMTVAQTCNLQTARSEKQGPADAVAEVFSVRRSAGRERVMSTLHSESMHRIAAEHVPGSRHRNLRVALLLRDLQTDRYGFPAYVLAYRYRGRLFRAVISGQRAQSVQATAPYSVAKIALAIAGGVGLVAGLLAALVLVS